MMSGNKQVIFYSLQEDPSKYNGHVILGKGVEFLVIRDT